MAKNRIFESGRQLYLPVAEGTKSGDPVLIGERTGIALTDRDAAGKAAIDFGGVYDLSVKAVNDSGNSAVAVGEKLFYNANDTPKLSKKTSGTFFGWANEVVNAGATDTIQVDNIAGPGPGTADILAGAIGTAELVDDAVTKAKMAPGTGTKCALLAGGAAGDHALANIAVGDELISVLHISTAAAISTMADITAEFTVAAGKITNAAGTDTSDDQLLVLYNDLT